MAIIKCPECRKKISDKAEVCPKCGFPMKKTSSILADFLRNADTHTVENDKDG